MASIQKFTDLVVWQKAHRFTLSVYKISESFPSSEQFGLTTQLRRAAVSVCSNIVEGFERGTSKEFKQFLIIARASLAESQEQLILARDLDYIDKTVFDKLAAQSVDVHKLLNGFMRSMKTSKLETRN